MRMSFGGAQAVVLAGLFATLPASSNYGLKAYDLGGAGGGQSSSATYKLNVTTGSQSGQPAASSSYGVKSGLAPSIEANVPGAPVLTNPNSYYDRLRLVLANPTVAGSSTFNATDAKYAIAISPDNFAATTRYVKSDHSISSALAFTDYQTYAAWGGSGGFLVLGLQPNTTYTVKVKAYHGAYTESPYSATASAATVSPTMTFSVATVGNSTPPFTVDFTDLAPGSIFNASDDVKLSLVTNALSGASIYIKDTNQGLLSSATGVKINSASADLASSSAGYGAIVTSATQLASDAPFNTGGTTVGNILTAPQLVAHSSGAVTAGSLVVRLMAKVDTTIPSANDYADTLTFVAAMAF